MIQHAHPEHPDLSLRRLCALFGLSRSWYYACPDREERAVQDLALRDAIEALVLEFPGYGYRRVTQAPRRAGWESVNHKRVPRLMREESLVYQLHRQFVVTPTTDSHYSQPTYLKLLTTAVLTGLNQAWVADITDIRLPTAFVYTEGVS